jgi:hypothetical protein
VIERERELKRARDWRLDDIRKLDASLAAAARLRTADTASEIRLRSRGRSMRRPERVHMPDPFREIEGDREHGQDGDQPALMPRMSGLSSLTCTRAVNTGTGDFGTSPISCNLGASEHKAQQRIEK